VCATRAGELLGELQALNERLPLVLTGGGAAQGEYVSGGSFGSRPPVVADVLNLLVGGDSIVEFAHYWAADWRTRLGHHEPEDAWVDPATILANLRGAQPGEPWQLPSDPDDESVHADAVANLIAAYTHVARHRGRVVLRLDTHIAPDPDPVGEQWLHRFGTPLATAAFHRDLAYLTNHRDRGLELPNAADFIQSLRALVGAARAAVGERSDLARVGRCPQPVLVRGPGGETVQRQETVTDHNGTTRTVPVWCGAVLWQDAFASVIACPACRTSWLKDRDNQWLRLGQLIRDVWMCQPCQGEKHEKCTEDRMCDCRHTRRGGVAEHTDLVVHTDTYVRARLFARFQHRRLLELAGAAVPELSEVDQAAYADWKAGRVGDPDWLRPDRKDEPR
jgi:hypothetical protein